jgi:gas vesicle protein
MLTSMDQRSRVLMSALLGAALGGVAGYLYLTEQGRRVRGQIEPMLDSIAAELERARATGEKVREVAREGERTLKDLVGEDRARSAWESTGFRQASS